MIFSGANLKVVAVASKDPFDRGLHGVKFEPDGSTVAGNERVLMAVGPADGSRVRLPDKLGEQMETGDDGLVMPVDAVQKALKYMSRDKRLTLQHVILTRVKDAARVGFTSMDAKGDTTTNAALPKRDLYPDWKSIVRKIRGSGEVKVCVNRKDLIELLKAMESACPDKGGINPVFIEMDGEAKGMVFRCINHDTGQHALGALTVFNTKGKWLEKDGWERKVFQAVARTVKKIRRVK